MAYYPQYYPQQPYPYQPPMMDNLAQLRAGQYQQPVPPQTPQPMPQQSGQSMVWVNGEQEAQSYLLAPNTAIALWDSTNPCIYLKQSDASGRPTIKTFDLVERTGEKHNAPEILYATKDELRALEDDVEKLKTKIASTQKKTSSTKENSGGD
nr:MAG TPA: hypothetical protein [Caudoviricetes sp.]